MFIPQENQPLAPFTTFGIGGPARYFAEAHTPDDIAEAVSWAEARKLPLFILGGGSNLLVRDTGFNGLVLHILIPGIDHLGNSLFAVGAGESWDTFVDYAVRRDQAGIECLAGIPGSVGGTPVQNVGAYGQEVAETISSVHVYDRLSKEFRVFKKADCHFRYRASRFNTDEPNRYIVSRVDFQLEDRGEPSLRYADLQRRFEDSAEKSTLTAVANTVIEIRRGKGMLLEEGNPDSHSAGSFFKNPNVPLDVLPRIAATLSIQPTTIPNWPADATTTKLPAAWLLEKAGFTKGFGRGPAGISSRHTLALINRGGATCVDIERLQNEIIATVQAKFSITLEREPVLIG
jgi:UDP-N-acetylmuramate dehydrogenase